MQLVARQVAVAVDNALAYERIAELNARLEEEKVYLEAEIRTGSFEEIVGRSRALKANLKQGAVRAGRHGWQEAFREAGRLGIIARYACGSTAQLGVKKEGVCAIRIILRRTGKSMRLSVW
jgi:GAF domain-containing protein